MQSLTKYLPGFTYVSIFGGSSINQQRRDLANTPDFIVATTGRLLDHIHNTKGFSLEDIDVLVLDEADRLIEMGFKDEIKQILAKCTNPKRQTIMVSATLNQDLKELASMSLKQPLTFTVQQQQRKADLANLKLT
jgi:ATP-dependent RNA helicase DDX27